MFGELVAKWQSRFADEAISVVIEVLEDSVRLSVRNSYRQLSPTKWNDLLSAPIADLVDVGDRPPACGPCMVRIPGRLLAAA